MKVDYQLMLSQIKQNVHEVDPTVQVWLYGSRAKGNAREDSDWDILVLSSKDKLSVEEEGRVLNRQNSKQKTKKDYLCVNNYLSYGILIQNQAKRNHQTTDMEKGFRS
ncbi:nucleotidyltransferase domain-containing protein [Parabacteroides sp. ASD2025]|jgi:predicted nucleotidyltransferase|uniref:nucleotidyltransferase domain-containing protein n=1 Tax=Parabacteroides sp. ASD2025 TaxID=3415987 RepID=UPI0025FC22BC|nr:nucleotidyltransferase domain-containing protein [uncultured Parabacteroides sp.]